MKRIMALLSVLAALTAMANLANAQETYRIKPGDVLRIEVLEDASINRDTLVLPDGRISVPLVGTVAAGGRTLSQVKSSVTRELAPNFANDPTVFVSLSRLAQEELVLPSAPELGPTVEVYVLGEVARSGKVTVAEGTTMLQLLAEIGGFSKFAAKKRIQLRRVDASGHERVYKVNYKDILAGKSGIGMTIMTQGDVIVVPERKLFE